MTSILKTQLFGLALLLTSMCVSSLEGQCALTPGCGPLATQDTVTGAIAVSSKYCLSLIQTDSKIASYSINQTTGCLTPCCDVVFPVTCVGPVVCGQQQNSEQGLAYSPDGKCLVAVDSGSGTLSTFKVKDDCCLSNQKTVEAYSPTSVAFPANACCFFVGEQGSQIASYTLEKCKARFESYTGQNQFISPQITLSPDGSILGVIDSSTNTVYLFCVKECDCSLSCKPTAEIKISGWNPTSLAFTPDNSCLAVTSTGSSTAVYTFCLQNCHVIPSAGDYFCSSIGLGPYLENPIQAVFSPVPAAGISPTTWCLAVAYQRNSSTNNGTIQLYTVTPSDSCLITFISPSYDPEGNTLGNSGVLGRSIAFTPNGDGLYFVTQQHIWSYLLGSTAEPVKMDLKDSAKKSPSYDNNKLLMYGAGAAAIGLFGWMLMR